MKFTFTLLIGFLLFQDNLKAQILVPDYHPYSAMTPVQLREYRQSIWNTLPAAIGWVNDFENLFSEDQEDSLERIISHFERKTSIEIAIVTVDSNMVAANKFNEFAYRILKEWGIGKLAKSNGIVILLCKDYQKLYVFCDFGIDKYLTDNEKSRIINDDFVSYFQKNNYYEGTLNGLRALIGKIGRNWERFNVQ